MFKTIISLMILGLLIGCSCQAPKQEIGTSKQLEFSVNMNTSNCFVILYNAKNSDCLWTISGVEYSKKVLWPYIYYFNTNYHRSPDLVVPGDVIKFPNIKCLTQINKCTQNQLTGRMYYNLYLQYRNNKYDKALQFLTLAIMYNYTEVVKQAELNGEALKDVNDIYKGIR